jgi:hypothetical protein
MEILGMKGLENFMKSEHLRSDVEKRGKERCLPELTY